MRVAEKTNNEIYFREVLEAIKKHCNEHRCCDCCFELPRRGCEMEGESCMFRVGMHFPEEWNINNLPWQRLIKNEIGGRKYEE